MGFRIMLNESRKEAYLLKDYDTEVEFEIKDITYYFTVFSSISWTFGDKILLYETNTISYYKLDGYKELNFITYNKEAHLIEENKESNDDN